MRWFRFYDEALDDPKVQRLPGELFKAWINLLCLASRNGGVIPCVADAAFALRVSEQDMAEKLAALIAAGLVDEGEETRPHGWQGRQYDSDSSADRMRRHRNGKTEQTKAVTVTSHPPSPLRPRTEQIQNRTDTEQNAATPLPFASPEFVTAWSGWEKHLREKRIKRTPTARDAQLAKCAGLGEARAITALRHSTEAGYTGLFEPKGGAVPFRSPAAVLATDEELAKAWGAK